MKKPSYTITILMNGLTYKGSGDTLHEAFDSLGLTFQDIKTKGEITVTKGDRKASRLLPLPKLRRTFASKMLKYGLINNFDKLLV